MGTTDGFGRPLGTLRVSVTDRCNLRCAYCMPEAEYVWLPRADLLTFEEIDRLVSIFVSLGVARVRLTGGEPLLRRDLAGLVGRLRSRDRPRGARAHDQRRPSGRAGGGAAGCRPRSRHRQPRHAGRRTVPAPVTLAGPRRGPRRHCGRRRPRSARSSSIPSSSAARTTTNCRRSSSTPAASAREIRFIEYMDVGGATHWSASRVVPRDRDRGPARARVRHDDADWTAAPRAGHALRAAERPDARHHRVDHPAVLRRLRSGPADGGRPAPHLPVCDERRRPARTAAKRDERRRSRDADSRRLEAPRRSRRRGAPRRRRIAPRSSPATRCGPSRTSKCTRAAADAAAAHRNSSVPVFEVRQGPDESGAQLRDDLPQSLRVMDTARFAHTATTVQADKPVVCAVAYRQVCIP